MRMSLPVLPAASVTCTSKVWPPGARSGIAVNGETHAANGFASNRHSVSVGMPPLRNVNVGDGSLVGPDGPDRIVTVGAIVSTVNVRLSVAVLSARSRTRTVKVCMPCVRVDVLNGDVHGANEPPSIRQSIVFAPDVVNVNIGESLFVSPVGPPVIVTLGPTVSTLKFRMSRFELPAASVARTMNT